MVIDLSGEIEPLSLPVRGSVADVMPTILDTQGIDAEQGVIGQSLFSRGLRGAHCIFPQKLGAGKWGLRDGQWKFIVHKADFANPELYDVDNDPYEQTNLAAKFPERIADTSFAWETGACADQRRVRFQA